MTLKGVKDDQGKNPLELLPVESLLAVGEVLRHGAAKYHAHNWRGGMLWSRLQGAALRHLFAHMQGQDTDSESGMLHLAHCACCILFLLSYQLTENGTNDRVDAKGQPLSGDAGHA